MAETESQPQPVKVENEELQLKYLAIVRAMALHAIYCVAKAYDLAKDKSGPLKPGVQGIESTVKIIVGPIYEIVHDVPDEVLKFVDRKVDDSLNKLDSHVPSFVKQASTQAFSAAQKAPAAAQAVASEVTGILETTSGFAKRAYAKYEPTAKKLYSEYEPVATKYAVSTWHSLNQHSHFARVANVVVPKAAYCTEKYNQAVQKTADKGYKISSFLPRVPTERIAEVFGSNEAGN